MENLVIILALFTGGSTLGLYLYKLYVETKREEIEAKYELQKHFDRLEQDEKEILAFRKRHLQQENERIAAKEVAEAARAIGSIGIVGKGLGGAKMLDILINAEVNKRLKREKYMKKHIEGNQDKSAFFDLLDVIVGNTKEFKKFKKQEIVNDNIHDPITGELLNIVQCSCKTISDKDSYLNYGCPNCGEKIINKK